jgi:hypothetical protein
MKNWAFGSFFSMRGRNSFSAIAKSPFFIALKALSVVKAYKEKYGANNKTEQSAVAEMTFLISQILHSSINCVV